MDTETNLYHILSASFLKAGYVVEHEVEAVLFRPLNLNIKAKVLTADNPGVGSSSVVLNISCRQQERIPDGISETAYGLADSYEKALEQAFSNWIISDFTPIHDYLCNSDNLLGGYAETASYSGELDEIIGWDLFFGPRLEASQNISTLEIAENKKNQIEMLQVLFQPMTDYLFGNPGLYYIRTFMSKINNSEIDCDCRVNGNDWEHGKNYLVDYISKYQAGSGIFWIKQNLLVVNKPADKIRSSHLLDDLKQALSEQREPVSNPQKKWWKFW